MFSALAAAGRTCPKNTALHPPRLSAGFDAGKKMGPGNASGVLYSVLLRFKRNFAGQKPFSTAALSLAKGGRRFDPQRKGHKTDDSS